MAEKQFTLESLTKSKKSYLLELAQSLHIPTLNLTKSQIIQSIINSVENATAYCDLGLDQMLSPEESLNNDQNEVVVNTQQGQQIQLQAITDNEMKFQLELKRTKLEEKQCERQERDRERQLEERERERQFQMTKLKMEYDLKALELTQQNSPALQNPTTQQPAFKVETAAKLLPKLSVDHELEVYLITFCKIAVLNNWPKEYWPAILQTQLKGKALRIFSELPESTKTMSNCSPHFWLHTN